MTSRRLFEYIEELTSGEDYVLGQPHPEPLLADWLDAEADAQAAYETWAADGDAEAYTVYRAYADQADAAQDALAAAYGA